jgi:hypothetical protein
MRLRTPPAAPRPEEDNRYWRRAGCPYVREEAWESGGMELAVLPLLQGAIRSAVFTPDGACVLTVSDDKTVHIRLVHPEEVVEFAHSRILRAVTSEELETQESRIGDD